MYSYAFSKDTSYTIGVNVRSDVATKVRFQFRLDGWPYTEVTSKVVDVTSTWQNVTLSGLYPFAEPGSLRVIPMDYSKDIYLDDMAIAAIPSAAAQPTGLSLPAQGNASVVYTPVLTSDMDGAFTRFDPRWFFNAWGGADEGSFIASRETRPAYVYAGASSQKFQIIDKKGGEIQFIAPYPFVNGKTYKVSAYLRSDVPTPTQFFVRMDAHPWQPLTTTTVTLNSTWQKVEIEGVFNVDLPGSVRIALPNGPGTVWVDDMTISEVVKNDLAPFSTTPVPDTMFGMHVNRFGEHHVWPGLGTKIVRLWDTGTNWRDLKPAAGSWNFTNAGSRDWTCMSTTYSTSSLPFC